MITAPELRSLMAYDPETGVFTWSKKISNVVKAGARAGSITNRGYWQIKIHDRVYSGHRLAWLYTYGEFPTQDIDHKNRNRVDNRIANLRLATDSQNQINSVAHSRNSSGIRGVRWHKPSRKWEATYIKDGVYHYLGQYVSKDEAANVRAAAVIAAFGEFARV